MKRTIIFLLIALATILSAQNLQFHYDFGNTENYEREHFTTTFEMFKPDAWGSTFAFVDFDYNDGIERNSASSAYWEITRNFNLPFVKGLSAGIQYNDGLNVFGGFGNVWLAGISYPINLKVVTLDTSLWLRDKEGQDPNFQITVVWYKPLFDGKLIFNGFVDIWGQENSDGWSFAANDWNPDEQEEDSQIVIISEPQIWYKLPMMEKLMIGGEIEISHNFIFGGGEDWYINPTLGLKWDF
jgi:Domain of unknown function (DUF5020)